MSHQIYGSWYSLQTLKILHSQSSIKHTCTVGYFYSFIPPKEIDNNIKCIP